MRGNTEADAMNTLHQIISEQRLVGGSGAIRGGYNCVCFTEAPEEHFHGVIGRYRPFGIRVSKRWLFSQGGRPVIYQSGPEYDQLPEALRWRHVRYEPDSTPPIDFSWEREWRINVNELPLPPHEVTVVVPHENYELDLIEAHFYHEHVRITFLQEAWGEMAAFEEEQPFAYRISVIPDAV
jgi:hypothetical protein